MHDISIALDPELDDALRTRLIEIWTDVSNAGGAVGFVPPVTFDDVARVAATTFARATDGDDHLVVAYEDGRPIGFLFLTRRPGPLFTHWVTIKRLQVHPQLQGRGYGSKILELVHDLARTELRLEQIHLTVRGGTGTERFYENHGYQIAARIPDVIRVAPNDDREEIYMVKRL